MKLTALMPCLNEEQTLQACIMEIKETFRGTKWEGQYEILVADNGSTDNSIAIAERNGARVINAQEKGYGNTLKAGINAALGEYVVMADSDMSYSWVPALDILDKLSEGDDLVMGNRFRGGIDPGAMPFLHKYLGNPVLTLMGQKLFKISIGDFHCGIRGVNAARLRALDLQSSGMEYASEMVVKAALANYRIAEVPAHLRKDGRDRKPHLRTWRDGWRHLTFMLVHCPDFIFDLPGKILMAIGGIIVLFLATSSRTIFNITFDVHTLLYGCAMVLLGFQAIILGRFTQIFGEREGILQKKHRKPHFIPGLITGLASFCAGAALSCFNLYSWSQSGYQAMTLETIRVAILALFFFGLGGQLIFAAFTAEALNQLQKHHDTRNTQ